jgi:phosphohistidine phosphatase
MSQPLFEQTGSAMKTLLLLRHAKSSWTDPRMDDHDRPLNDRGRMAAPVMGQFITDRGLVPDLVLCSTASRAQETLERASSLWPRKPKVISEKGLYLAAPHKMIERIRQVGPEVGRLLIVGHNPGFEDLSVELAGAGDSAALRRMGEKFPTAGLAVIAFDISQWSKVERSRGTLLSFVSPRDLV